MKPHDAGRGVLVCCTLALGCGDGSSVGHDGDSDPFADCERTFEGDVFLAHPPDPADLDALARYDCITGNLRIWGTLQRDDVCVDGVCDLSQAVTSESLAGLSGLRHVGGNLEVGATLLADLEFLAGLERVDGDLRLQKNLLMTTLQGPAKLARVGGSLRILDHDSLAVIDGFEALTSTGGLELAYNRGVVDPNSLRGVLGLSALTDIDGDLVISGTTSWPSSLEGLTALQRITGSLWIGTCDGDDGSLGSLRGLEGLEALVSVGADVGLSCVDGLEDLSALRSLETIGGSLFLLGNPFQGTSALEHLGFTRLDSIGGDLVIVGNVGLVDLDGLDGIERVENLQLGKLLALDPEHGLDHLAGLQRVDGDLEITQCGIEQSLAETFASGVEVSGEVRVCENGPSLDGC